MLCCLALRGAAGPGGERRALPPGHGREPAAAARAVRRRLAIAAAAVVAIGCGGGGNGAAATPEPRRRRPPPPRPPSACSRSARSSDPLYVTAPPGDRARVFVVEQGGTIRIVRGGQKLDKPFLDVSDIISSGGERGLLSLAFAPDYARAGLFYVYYTDPDGDARIVEYKRRTDDEADPDSARQVLRSPGLRAQPQRRPAAVRPRRAALHRHRRRRRGRRPARRAIGNGQALDTLLGKILRIDPRRSGSRPYSVPRRQPVRRPLRRARPEIYSYGLRNPWRFSFDRQTGDLIDRRRRPERDRGGQLRAPRQGPGRELRLARVRGPRPLHGRRARARRGRCR